MQHIALPDGHQAVEAAKRASAAQDLHAGSLRLRRQLAHALAAAFGELRAARLEVLVAEHHIGAQLRGAQRSAQAGDATADHEHVTVAATVFSAPFALLLTLWQPAQPGGVAQRLLIDRPQPARADERLVVEADGHEGAGKLAGRAHQVKVERGPRVLVLDAHAREHRRRAGAHARGAVHLHQRVGALAAAAQLPARAVVLERPREHAAPRGQQRGCDRVALVGADGRAVEGE